MLFCLILTNRSRNDTSSDTDDLENNIPRLNKNHLLLRPNLDADTIPLYRAPNAGISLRRCDVTARIVERSRAYSHGLLQTVIWLVPWTFHNTDDSHGPSRPCPITHHRDMDRAQAESNRDLPHLAASLTDSILAIISGLC